MKILISDKSAAVCGNLLREAGHDVDENSGLAPDELKAIIGQYHGLIIRSATKVTPEILDAADNLKVIGRAGTGIDNINLAAATEKGVAVMNTPGGNSNAVAELALAKMIMLARSMYIANASLKDHKWEKKSFKGTEISGKTLGLLGYGRVSRLLAGKALALGMTVLIHDPKIRKDLVDSDGLTLVSTREAVLNAADYLSIHLTKRADTAGSISSEAFAAMKDGAYLINCARGGIVDEDALLAALDSGKLAGAALDVFENEPPTDFRLVDHERVICTPHIAASSKEAQEKVAVMVAEQFIDFFAGRPAENIVNK